MWATVDSKASGASRKFKYGRPVYLHWKSLATEIGANIQVTNSFLSFWRLNIDWEEWTWWPSFKSSTQQKSPTDPDWINQFILLFFSNELCSLPGFLLTLSILKHIRNLLNNKSLLHSMEWVLSLCPALKTFPTLRMLFIPIRVF